MSLTDFEGLYRFKFIIPTIYVLSWISMLVGPWFFNSKYQIVCFGILCYSILKSVILAISGFIANKRLTTVLQRYNIKVSQQSAEQLIEPLFHAIVIPSFKQDTQLLTETLNELSKHKGAQSAYLIYLAMEAHQQGCQKKANFLIQAFKSKFKIIEFTKHFLKKGQSKGKASNVSWCVQHMKNSVESKMIDLNSIIITVLDADSWASEYYFSQVEHYIRNNKENKDIAMFSAPQIYTRNNLQVPAINRVFDIMHSFAHLGNLPACFFSFPLSNYSVSYKMMENIGFWDTCHQAIGQDFHTCQKGYWKTDGKLITVPIYVPFNQLSLTTGKGYIADVQARFWQAQRHTQGVADVAYNFKMLFSAPFKLKNILLTFLVLETFIIAAIVPWAMISLIIKYFILESNDLVFSFFTINVLINVANLLPIVGYFSSYQVFKRKANFEIYKRNNQPLWRLVQYPIWLGVALFGFAVPAFTISAFSVLFSQRTYRVAEKVVKLNSQQNLNPQSTRNIEQISAAIENISPQQKQILSISNENVSYSYP